MAMASSMWRRLSRRLPMNNSALPRVKRPAARLRGLPVASPRASIRAPRLETTCHSARTIAAFDSPAIDESSSRVSPRRTASSAARSQARAAVGETRPPFIIRDRASRFWTWSSRRSRSGPAGIPSTSSRARPRWPSTASYAKPALGAGGGFQGEGHRLLGPDRGRRPVEVIGQRREAGFVPGQVFEGGTHPGVESGPADGAQLVVQGLADEGVGEPVAADRPPGPRPRCRPAAPPRPPRESASSS